jgi:hypothetical protein
MTIGAKLADATNVKPSNRVLIQGNLKAPPPVCHHPHGSAGDGAARFVAAGKGAHILNRVFRE